MQSYLATLDLKRFLLAAFLVLAAGFASAQSSASHKVVMRVITSNRVSVKPAAQSSFDSPIAFKDAERPEDPSTLYSRTMDFVDHSLRIGERRKTVVSVRGVVNPGVALGIKPAGTDGSDSLRTAISPVASSYDLSGMIDGSVRSTSAVTLTVSVDDPDRRAESESGMIMVTYTII
jgi:hypothetical protein